MSKDLKLYMLTLPNQSLIMGVPVHNISLNSRDNRVMSEDLKLFKSFKCLMSKDFKLFRVFKCSDTGLSTY